MPAHSRLGDIGVGICCCHSDPPCIPMVGPLITASTNTSINGLGAARLTDIVIGACGHPGVMITSSTTAKVNGLGAVRVGDFFTGCFTGTIVTGSPNQITGG